MLSPEQPVEVRQLVRAGRLSFQRIPVRHTERGVLDDPFALRRVWTLRDGVLAEEWLVIRHENERRYTYALSNAAADSPAARLAALKGARHFVNAVTRMPSPKSAGMSCRPKSTAPGHITWR